FNVTDTTAEVTWNESTDDTAAASYQVEFYPGAGDDFIIHPDQSTGTHRLLTGLYPGAIGGAVVRVRAADYAGNMSPWTAYVAFPVPLSPGMPKWGWSFGEGAGSTAVSTEGGANGISMAASSWGAGRAGPGLSAAGGARQIGSRAEIETPVRALALWAKCA